MRGFAKLLLSAVLFSKIIYSADEQKDGPLVVGVGIDKGLQCSYAEVTNRFKTVITILTTQNKHQESSRLKSLNETINSYAHAVPAEIADAQTLQTNLHRKVEDAVTHTFDNCKAQMAALIVLLHDKGVWRADYTYASDTDATERKWTCSKVCGAFDPAHRMQVIPSGFKRLDFIQPPKHMTWPQAAEHQIINNQHYKLHKMPSGVVLLVDLKIWQEYFKKKQSESWMHTIGSIAHSTFNSIDLSRFYGLRASFPSMLSWQ